MCTSENTAKRSSRRAISCKRGRVTTRKRKLVPSQTLVLPQTHAAMPHPARMINRVSGMIVSGEYDTAIESLTVTLRHLKLALLNNSEVTKNDPNDSSHNDRNSLDPSTYSSINLTTSGVFEYDFHHPSPDTSALSDCQSKRPTNLIFENPLIVTADASFEVPLTTRLCEELSCVAMYNLALSHQLKAFSLSSALKEKAVPAFNSAYLYKALRIYEHSHKLFKHRSVPLQTPVLYGMALACNIGEIHRWLGDCKKAQECSKYLLSCLMYTIDRRRVLQQLETSSQPPQHPNQSQAVDGFLDIAQHLVISQELTAPAA